jgi:hypothetical protein
MSTRRPIPAKADASPMARFGLRPDGGWADAASADVAAMGAKEQSAWLAFFDHANAIRPRAKFKDWGEAQLQADWMLGEWDPTLAEDTDLEPPPAVGSDEFSAGLRDAGPGDAWFEQAEARIAAIGKAPFREVATRWILAATRSSSGHLNRPGAVRELLRALLWCAGRFDHPETVEAIRQLAGVAMRKRANQALTCGIVLGVAETRTALAALTLLAEEADRPSSRERYTFLADHVIARSGISRDEAAEGHIPTFGFDPATGTIVQEIGGCRAELCIDPATAAVETIWTNEKGKPTQSVPAAAKKASADAVKRLAGIVRSAGDMIASQRDRLERLMRQPREWAYENWRACYLDHPLVRPIASKLIWLIDDVAVEATQGKLRTVKGTLVKPTGKSIVRVWHPVNRKPAEIVAWRQRLEELNVSQPFKQVYREIYLLTDAERRTAMYSNRFAGHILRQHQLAALGRHRGWEYRLAGPWDAGDATRAKIDLPQFKLRAEYWAQGAGEETTHSGVFQHVATDQVRFYPRGEDAPIALETVDPLAFSEVMRDVDLFVGVASIGNDPTWQDGGPGGHHRQYWWQFSFGELTELARTRHTVLERLLPRLKIASRCKLSEKFLTVRGSLRTYKIHLGSGNILMSPNDQYLCIVPDRSDAAPANVFLPFEGDRTLSIILSKAFLLAEDGSITDPTITRQIKS